NDLLGAVLVDKGYTSTADGAGVNVDWTIVDGHVGNNKWAYNAASGRFETEGTTAVGAWLFYTKYNEKMTTTRNGVEFDFPQIQEGATNLKQVENNNINFKITPILAIDGYEGEKLDLNLMYASVYSYLNIKLAFAPTLGVTKVQKIVLSATKQDASTMKFPTEYKLKNTNIPVAKLSLKAGSPMLVTDHVAPVGLDLADQNAEILAQYNALRSNEVGNTTTWSAWDATTTFNELAVTRNSAKDVEYLVLDCNSNHADTSVDGSLDVVNNQFSGYMLVPAGVYGSITLDIYTDKGVYREKVTGRDAYVVNRATPGTPATTGKIFLRPNKAVVLADVEGNTG
ncbi:MAG: hypothetical protein PUG15_09540, partial [Bacteroidales bacterium]|nr:hypothetical protein [Bacteroidales bacterium]